MVSPSWAKVLQSVYQFFCSGENQSVKKFSGSRHSQGLGDGQVGEWAGPAASQVSVAQWPLSRSLESGHRVCSVQCFSLFEPPV